MDDPTPVGGSSASYRFDLLVSSCTVFSDLDFWCMHPKGSYRALFIEDAMLKFGETTTWEQVGRGLQMVATEGRTTLMLSREYWVKI